MSEDIIAAILIICLLLFPFLASVCLRLGLNINDRIKNASEFSKGICILASLTATVIAYGLTRSKVLTALIWGIVYFGCLYISTFFKDSPLFKRWKFPKNKHTKNIISEAQEHLNRIRYFSSVITNPSVKAKVDIICIGTDKIIAKISKSPGDIKTAKKFLGYYLDTTTNILEKYMDISTIEQNTPEAKTRLDKIENALDLIIKSFEEQTGKLNGKD